MARSELILPPGFRFHPTDEELVIHYLCNKCVSNPVPVSIIKELDLYKYDPWQLPELALYGEKEWYFFSPRDRKYPNGSRPNRAARTGYWKATGADKPIGRPKTRGIKKALVFYAGKAPKGVKTNWIMHEYRLANVDRSARKKNSDYLRLDDWVLCRLYNKKGRIEKHSSSGEEVEKFPKAYEEKPKIPMPVQNNEVMNNQLGVETLDWLHSGSSDSEYVTSDIMTPDNQLDIDTSDWFHAGTSDSEHVTSSNVTCEREVQSGADWSMLEKRQLEEQNEFDLQLDFMNGFSDDPFGIIGPQAQFQMDQVSSFQDMYLYLQKT